MWCGWSVSRIPACPCCMLCPHQIHPQGFFGSPKTGTWSEKLYRIYLDKDRQHWWEGRCTWKFSGKPLLPSKYQSKKWSSHLGFDSTEAGQWLCWRGGEEGITEITERNEDLSKCLCNLKQSKWRSGHNLNTQLESERKEAEAEGRVNALNDSASTTGRQKKDGHGGKCWIQENWADAGAFNNRCPGDRRRSGVGLQQIKPAEPALRTDIRGGSGRAGERWEGQGENSFVGPHKGIVEEIWATQSMIKWLEKQERNGWWGKHFRQDWLEVCICQERSYSALLRVALSGSREQTPELK